MTSWDEDKIRATNAATGGEKEVSPLRYDLLPVLPLREVAKLYGVGAAKYAAHNWRRGYEWSNSYSALQRHAQRFWSGESIDPQGGFHHLAAVVFHALALMEFERTHPELDDRWQPS